MKACSWAGRQWDTQNTTKRVRIEPNCAEYAVIVKMLLAKPGTMVDIQDNVRMSIHRFLYVLTEGELIRIIIHL